MSIFQLEKEIDHVIDNIYYALRSNDVRLLSGTSYKWLIKSCVGFDPCYNWDGFTEYYTLFGSFKGDFIANQGLNQCIVDEDSKQYAEHDQRQTIYNSIINAINRPPEEK